MSYFLYSLVWDLGNGSPDWWLDVCASGHMTVFSNELQALNIAQWRGCGRWAAEGGGVRRIEEDY